MKRQNIRDSPIGLRDGTVPDSPQVETATVLGCCEAEHPKRRFRHPWVGGDRVAHEFGRARNRETGHRKLEKDAEEGKGGRAVFMVIEKAARLVRLRLA
jgi:hypothetical protein